MPTGEILLDTERGPSRLVVATPVRPNAILLLGHGAGGGIDAFDLDALAARLPARGIALARYEQPWRTAGKRIAGPPDSLDVAWARALEEVRRRWPRVPLFVGGRSAGARVACRCFAEPARGLVALSFPLHPPGRPEKSRRAEIAGVRAPMLVIQGDRDPFGSAADVRAALPGDNRTVVEIPAAGHSLQPGKRADPDGAAQLIVDSVAAFVLAERGA